MAKSRGSIPEPAYGAKLVAGDQYPGPLFRSLGTDGVEPGCFLLVDLVAGISNGGFFRTNIYHLSRLRTWLLLQVEARQ